MKKKELIIKNAILAIAIIIGVIALFQVPVTTVTIPGEGTGLHIGVLGLFIILMLGYLTAKFSDNIENYHDKKDAVKATHEREERVAAINRQKMVEWMKTQD